MVFCTVSLESMAVRAQRLQVRWDVVVVISVSVVYIQLSPPLGNKATHFTERFLKIGHQPATPVAA